MDPSATLRSILENLNDLHNATTDGEVDPGYRETAVYLLRELARWLEHGGRAPSSADLES